MSKKLNLGCGTDIRKGWVNLDSVALPGVDVVHDIASGDLPFDDDSFDHIECQDILEHLPLVPSMKELHRLLKVGGTVQIRVPHYTSRRNFEDPTHCTRFAVKTLYYFTKESQNDRPYYFEFHFTKVVSLKICFEKKWIFPYNYLIEPVINRFSRVQHYLYEGSFLGSLFPAENLLVILQK